MVRTMRCWVLKMFFLHFSRWSYGFVCFSLVLWWTILVDFQMLNQLYITEVNFTWVWCVIYLYIAVWYANTVLEAFVSVLMKDIDLWFHFLIPSLSGFGIRVMLASQNNLGSVPSSPFLEEFMRLLFFLLMFWRIHHWCHLDLVRGVCGVFFLRGGILWITNSISETGTGLFTFSVSFVKFGKLYLLRNLSISYNFQYFWHKVVQNILWLSL